MTLRIAKIEEPRQKRRVAVDKPVTSIDVTTDVNNPEPEVVGIPGLVQQMIGRFSCLDFDGVSNGNSHSTRPAVKPSTAPLAQAKPLVSLVTGPQRNASHKISKTHTHCEEGKEIDESRHTELSDLHSSRSSSRTRPNQRVSGADEGIEPAKFIFSISDSDSNRNLSKSNSTQATIDSSSIKAPPLHPKSNRALNLYRTSPKTQGSSLNNCDGQTNKLHNSEIEEEVNSSLSFVGVQNHVNSSVGESFSEISQKNCVSNGQCHIIPVVSGDHESVAEMEKCSKNGETDDVQKTENDFNQKPNTKDGHYFLGVMSDVEQELTKHCTQLEQFLSGPITDEASGKVRAAIGKANLLMTRKFKQFEELCHKNLVDSTSEPFKTTSEDLTGFWDLVHLQVDDVQRLFSEIYKLHHNHWIDTEPEETLLSPKVMEAKPKEQLVKSVPKKAKSPGTSEASKAREEARKRLLAAKMAGRQRKASEREEDVQIFIS